MNRNRIFDFQRMKLLIRRDLRENWRQFLLNGAAMFGVLVLIGILVAVMKHDAFQYYQNNIENWHGYISSVEVAWLTFAMFAWGAMVASSSFKALSTPPTALSLLILPASQSEKYIYRWLVAVPLFFVIFVVFAMLADLIRVGFMVSYYDIPARPVDWWTLFVHPREAGYFYGASFIVIAFFFAVQSFFLLGSVVWTRLAFVKTFVALMVMVMLYVWFGTWFYDLLEDPDKWYAIPAIFDDEKRGPLLCGSFFTIVALFNYCLTFMRFRESDIINRW